MEFKRVVVTGLGTVNPLGNSIEEYWEGLKNGKSGAGPITHFDASHTKQLLPASLRISTHLFM